MENLLDRLKAVIDSQTESHRRFKDLEERTGLKADAWKNFYNGRQRPTWEMIEGVSKAWPHLAFWLATGIDDADHGHQKIDAYTPIAESAATKYFTHRVRDIEIRNRFHHAMKTAKLVRETEGEYANHMRYDIDQAVFKAYATGLREERLLFIAREQEEAPLVAAKVERLSNMDDEPISDDLKLYAPITN